MLQYFQYSADHSGSCNGRAVCVKQAGSSADFGKRIRTVEDTAGHSERCSSFQSFLLVLYILHSYPV